MIPLYMDEHVPRADQLKRAFFTSDDDLLVEAAKRQKTGQEFHGVIYAHPLKVSIGKCIKELETLSTNGNSEEIRNQVIFLPI